MRDPLCERIKDPLKTITTRLGHTLSVTAIFSAMIGFKRFAKGVVYTSNGESRNIKRYTRTMEDKKKS